MSWQLETVRADFLSKARQNGLDDQGQAVLHRAAEGGEPCRDALRRARPGEALLLASYSPFQQAGPYKEYGPIFLLADAAADSASEPCEALFRPGHGYLSERYALRAYTGQQMLQEALYADADSAPAHLERWRQDPGIAFVMARFPAYGCYAFRLNKVNHD